MHRSLFPAVLAALLLTEILPVGSAATPGIGAWPPSRSGAQLTSDQQLARDIFQQLIEINTTDSVGDTTEAAEAMAVRLRAAGFADEDVQVLGPHARKGNLVVRYRGSGEREPLLLLAHIDVVEARPEDWSFDPFTFREVEGYFYGRGTSDDKAMAAIWVANFITMKEQGYVPDRDLIVALTADEEGGDYNGVTWLIENHRNLIEAQYALNEGGGGALKDGRRMSNDLQASEKVYLTFHLEVTNPGGHSSLPAKDNAIYRLANGLARLAQFDFPVVLNEVTQYFFERMAEIETGQTAADMKAILATPPDAAAAARLSESVYYNALLRTTCVATQLDAGHAENALPQRAAATVNCRILPGESTDAVLDTLLEVLDDEMIAVTPVTEPTPSPPSPLNDEILGPVESITEQMWPGVPTIPTMLTGATDGLFLRNAGIPTYGVSGLFSDIDDVRAHGQNERIRVDSFFEGQEFLYRLVKAMSSS